MRYVEVYDAAMPPGAFYTVERSGFYTAVMVDVDFLQCEVWSDALGRWLPMCKERAGAYVTDHRNWELVLGTANRLRFRNVDVVDRGVVITWAGGC